MQEYSESLSRPEKPFNSHCDLPFLFIFSFQHLCRKVRINGFLYFFIYFLHAQVISHHEGVIDWIRILWSLLELIRAGLHHWGWSQCLCFRFGGHTPLTLVKINIILTSHLYLETVFIYFWTEIFFMVSLNNILVFQYLALSSQTLSSKLWLTFNNVSRKSCR